MLGGTAPWEGIELLFHVLVQSMQLSGEASLLGASVAIGMPQACPGKPEGVETEAAWRCHHSTALGGGHRGEGPERCPGSVGLLLWSSASEALGSIVGGGGLLRPDVKRGLLSFCAESTHGASLLHVNPNCWVQNFTRSRSCYDVNQLCPAFGFR